MKLALEIEWHNLINNPDDLPDENDLCMLAFLKDGNVEIDCGAPYGYHYSYTKCLFYCDDDEYGRLYCDRKCFENLGQIVAWAIQPAFEKMEPALNKWLLDKEAAENV